MNTQRQAELFWSGFLLLTALIGLTWLIPNYVHLPTNLQNPYLSPRLWPTIIFYCLGALGLCMFTKSLFALYTEKKVKVSWSDTAAQDNANRQEKKRQSLSVLTCLGSMVLCLVLVEPLGMPLAVTLCLAALFFLSGKKASLRGILCLLALPVCLYLFFLHVADVSIPLGILG